MMRIEDIAEERNGIRTKNFIKSLAEKMTEIMANPNSEIVQLLQEYAMVQQDKINSLITYWNHSLFVM